MRCVSINVAGKVQGVFFRQRTKEMARSLRVNGFARNESDGTVYIEACGDDDKIDQLIEWCRKGPQRAEVKNIDVLEIPLKEYSSFDIRH